ncbi:hypothetical protein ACH4C6_26735 [Streptomyces sp. NPDC017943]
MAYVNKAGEVTSYHLIWRLGGSQAGAPQVEQFEPSEEGREAAGV